MTGKASKPLLTLKPASSGLKSDGYRRQGIRASLAYYLHKLAQVRDRANQGAALTPRAESRVCIQPYC